MATDKVLFVNDLVLISERAKPGMNWQSPIKPRSSALPVKS